MHQMVCPVLVGRQAELDALVDSLRAARAGEGKAVIVGGVAGVGKSRLGREVEAAAREEDMAVLVGRAVQQEGSIPFRPLAEALLSLFRVTGPPDAPELRSFRPALGHLIPEWDEASPARGPAPEQRSGVVLGEAVLRLLRVLGRSPGCLLVLEDLHWADPDTLALVEYLSDNLGREPVMCLVTLRSEEGQQAWALAEALSSRRAAEIVRLDRLADDQVARMVRACLAEAEVAPVLDAFVKDRADGLPFFVEELLAGLVGSEALVREGRSWRVVNRIVPAVPLTFADTVQRRLSVVADRTRDTLAAAAVLGRRFDWTLLPAVTGLDEPDVLDGLREAVDAQLVVVESGGDSTGFRFRHALTRDVVLDGLLPPQHQALARRALDAVERARPDLPGEWCELGADLAERAGDPERAGRLLVEAARRGMAKGGLATAEAALERARSLAGDDASLAFEADEALAQAHALAGRVDEAIEVGGRALERAAEAGAPPLRRALLHLALARAAVAGGRWQAANRHVEAARSAAGEVGHEAVGPPADALAAHVAIGEGRLPDAVASAEAAVAGAERAGLLEVACEALEVLGRCARLRDLADAEGYFQRALETAERHGLTLWRVRALHELGTVDLLDNLRQDRLLAAGRAAADAGALATVALVELHLAAVYLSLCRYQEAGEAARRCLSLSERLGLATLGMAHLQVAVLEAVAGRRQAMEASIAEALAAAPGDLDVAAGAWGRARMFLPLYRADWRQALHCLDRAVELLRQDPSRTLPFVGFWALLRTVEGLDDADAREHARRSASSVFRINRGFVGFAEAVALGRAGRAAEAEAAFAAAEAELAVYDRPKVWRPIAHLVVSQAAADDGWGDPAGWLRGALAALESLGEETLASACRAALRRVGAKVPRRRGGTEVPAELRALGVTSREVEVLRLVGERLSNREIGARLYLSPRTVERHVANLLSKLGGKNRAQLADVAARAGVTADSA